MTPEQLSEIEQRWTKATRGPWIADMRPVATECGECGEYSYEVAGVVRRKSDGCGIVDVQDSEKQNENAQAIASAPTDIALLLAEVRRLQEKLHYEETCHAEAQEEVRRLNRMVDKAVDYLEHSCCDAPQSFDCEEINRACRDCWKEYLESEVADNG